MGSVRFESRLAERIHAGKGVGRPWKTYASLVAVVFIVLTLTASTIAVPQVVVHVGSQGSMAKYLGQFDGKSSVVMVGLSGPEDWVCMKLPFKGHMSDLDSISFSILIAQTGGGEPLEPYVVLKLPEGRSLVCDPVDSYSAGNWSQPYMSWQVRDLAADGKWTVSPAKTQSLLVSLDSWIGIIGDQEVLSIFIYFGAWDVSDPFLCYMGDIAVNGKLMDVANAGRLTGPSKDMPIWF